MDEEAFQAARAAYSAVVPQRGDLFVRPDGAVASVFHGAGAEPAWVEAPATVIVDGGAKTVVIDYTGQPVGSVPLTGTVILPVDLFDHAPSVVGA